MRHEIDFLGRSKPWGDQSLKNTLIVDEEYWVFFQHWNCAVVGYGVISSAHDVIIEMHEGNDNDNS